MRLVVVGVFVGLMVLFFIGVVLMLTRVAEEDAKDFPQDWPPRPGGHV